MVRYKPLPPARSLAETREIHRAVPADPTATDDCCSRLQGSAPVPDRSTAREWLGFFEALELVDSDGDGYYRLDWPGDQRELGERLARRVLGASELLEAVEKQGPVTADRLVEQLEDSSSIRARDGPDPDTRVRRLLDWSRQFGVLTESDGEYRSVDPETTG